MRNCHNCQPLSPQTEVNHKQTEIECMHAWLDKHNHFFKLFFICLLLDRVVVHMHLILKECLRSLRIYSYVEVLCA